MKYRVIRCSKSSYQSSADLNYEKSRLESIKKVEYYGDLNEISHSSWQEDERAILITNTHTILEDLNEDLLARTDLIIHPNSGFDNFNAQWLEEKKIPVLPGNEIRAHAVIEYTLSSLFHFYNQLPIQPTWDKGRLWPRKLIKDQNILIIGHGMIGKKLAQAIDPLCNELHIHDPYKGQDMLESINLKEIDVILMAASLNEKNRHMINHSFLSQLKDDALIINGARGELIDEQDLINYMEKNSKAYAYLDVFNQEPNTFDDFKNLNVFTTSHIAGVFGELNPTMTEFLYQRVYNYIHRPMDFMKQYEGDFLNHRIIDNMII